jgi:hypothetical protein
MPSHPKDQDRIKRLIEHAWLLSETDIAHVTPTTPVDQLESLISLPVDAAHPLRGIGHREIQPEDLMRVMRDPNYFPFTCKLLMGIDIMPFQHVILRELWMRPFPMLIGSRGLGKSFILALYSMLRLVFTQGSKVAVIGASFRQSKVIFEYMEKVWADGAVLRDLCGTGKGRAGREQGPRRDVDRCEMIIGDSVGIAIPLGNGEKIRGQRANYIVADEFACLGRGTLVETDRGLFRIEETEDMRDFCLNTGDERGYEEPAHFIKTPPTKAYKVTVRSGYSFVCSGIHQVLTREGWKLGRDLVAGDMLTMPNSYEFPKNPVVADDLVLDGNLSWCLGLLISEGAVVSPHITTVLMTDKDCLDRLADKLGNFVSPERVKRYSRDGYVDKRGWVCKPRYSVSLYHKQFRQKLAKLGLEYHKCHDKRTPSGILQSPRQVVISYLAGLFEGDGSAFLFESRGRCNHLGVAYYSVSEQLVRETQILLLKLGLKSSIQVRASKLSDNPQWMLRLNGAHAHKLVDMLQIPKWQKVVDAAVEPVDRSEAGVVWDKSRNKWAARVADFGKSKHLGRFDSREEALSCVLQEKKMSCQPVISVEELPGEQVLFDYYLPEGNRFVANGFVQHNSIPEDIYQNVVRGFASVSADPASGVRHQARVQLLKKLGQWTKDDDIAEAKIMRSNQNIISGTAYYSFNHFYKTWKTYKAFIESCGDRKKLEEIFDGPVPEGFDWKDFSIIRIPVDMLPRGFMDEKQISSARATLSKSNYMIEFGASFATDSEGFFKRSLIESCVVGRSENPIVLNEEAVEFSASLMGDDVCHVIAVDPASERDHFSVVVLALYPDHRRLVHCWTTNRKSHKERLKRGVVKEQNFYAFCARKLRELMLAFPNVEVLGIDSQGGGVTVEESLHDLEKLKDGEMPLWREIDPDPKKYKDSDNKPGLHIIRMINFADGKWIVDSNHGLRKDLEDKVLLLPAFDTAALGLAYEEDKASGRIVLEDGEEVSLYDTLEDAVVDIEELKDELASIVHTATSGGRDRWDVPGAKLPGSKAGKQRKDRYSALLMANSIARTIQRTDAPQEYHPVGGFATSVKDADGDLYIGPAWFVEATRGEYGAAVGRDGVELADPTA